MIWWKLCDDDNDDADDDDGYGVDDDDGDDDDGYDVDDDDDDNDYTEDCFSAGIDPSPINPTNWQSAMQRVPSYCGEDDDNICHFLRTDPIITMLSNALRSSQWVWSNYGEALELSAFNSYNCVALKNFCWNSGLM